MSTNLPRQIKATSYSPAIPILKGVGANPIVKVVISVPQGNMAQQYRYIHCTINAAALNELQQVDVYETGAEPFSSNKLIASVNVLSTSFDIPVSINVLEGQRFIWLSAVLKNEALLINKIEVHAIALIDAAGKKLLIIQGNSNYEKQTGIAIRKAGDDKVNGYRIPGIVSSNKGTLLAVYDIRYKNSGDLPGNIDVGLSRSTDSGKTWEPMKIIMDMGEPNDNNGVGDPAILFDPVTKKIWVAALWSKGNHSIAGSLPGLSPDTTGQLVLTSSSDDGITWTTPYTITPQVKNPAWHIFFQGPGNGIAMEDGKLIFATQYWNESKVPYSTIIYSNNHGLTWEGKILGPKSNTTESQVVETTPGTLMLNMRDNRGGYRSVATTNDLGSNWTEHSTSFITLPDPICMGSLIKAKVNVDGKQKEILFFSNPNTSLGRYNITIKASLDLGETWLPLNKLLIDERVCFGYSSLTKIDDNTIGILYEGIKDLYFIKIFVSDIIKQNK
ncbi:MAG: sialidase family protein [Ferruginibacter sp.]